MFSICKHSYPATGIEHAIYCHFFSSGETNLVTASVNCLNVYRFNEDDSSDIADDTQTTLCKLECMATYSLFGNVMSMRSVQLPGATRCVILLTFRDAKLSVVQYDPDTHDLQTLSLHYFEDERVNMGLSENLAIPTVRVDPDGRCAVMLFFNNQLVVLPLRRDVATDDHQTSGSPISSSYIIDLSKMTDCIDNVLDIQFLYGYHEPTVFVLFEPHPTSYGRVAIRNDTCQIVAISLNIQDKVNPVIWFLEGLPFDCFRVLAIPKPIGGVVVFAANSMIYLNQSVPPYGVSLNSIADASSSFPLRQQKDVCLALDSAQVCLISNDKIVASLKGGELYVITLVVDSMRSVRSFHFSKAASSVYTTCVIQCDDGYLFLGSRLGNSLLVRYAENLKKSDVVEPPAKKKKSETTGSNESELLQLDPEALDVYGSTDAQSGTTITSYTFEVCDSLLNIAPCGDCTLGEPAFLSEEFASSEKHDLEIVIASGYGKNGSLAVLQRTIRPQVVTTFDLPGCVDMWTVFGRTPQSVEDSTSRVAKDAPSDDPESSDTTVAAANVSDGHAYLILSRGESTMILQTGQEITELGQSGFSTQTRTIYAGNIGENDRYILQVTQMGVRLLDGTEQLHHIPIDIGSNIAQCSVADPYVLLMSEEGIVMVVTLKPGAAGSGVRLTASPSSLSETVGITAIAAYVDTSGLFTTVFSNDAAIPEHKSSGERSFTVDMSVVDDEDELLYGDSDVSAFNAGSDKTAKEKTASAQPIREAKIKNQPTFWCFVMRENGEMEIYSLPDFKLVYYIRNVTLGMKRLSDSGLPANVKQRTDIVGDDASKELVVAGLGRNKARPHMLFFVSGELFIYEAYPFNCSSAEEHLKIRFKKVNHRLLLRDCKIAKLTSKEKTSDSNQEQPSTRLRVFDNIGGYSGIFIAGQRPHWLIMTSHGVLRYHPMTVDGAIQSMAPFHNVNCPRGFLYFNKKDEMRICSLPSHMTYDAPWSTRKVMLRRTPYFVVYHPDSRMYAVVTSTPQPCNKFPHAAGEDKEIDELERDERFIYPSMDMFKVELFSPSNWEPVPNTEIKLDEWENVTCMQCANLKYEGAASGMKTYIAVGTTLCFSEEVPSRGRIILFDIVEVVPEPGQPSRQQIKIFIDSEQRSAVTAICTVTGFLVTAVGQKIYIWQIKDNNLSGMAFIDTHIYIHSLASIKNLIIAADILKSILLYRYQDDKKVLSIVSRDVKRVEVYAVNFLIDNQQLSFIVTDRHKNVLVYSYSPENRESHGGQRLLRKADFNSGSHINSMFRVPCRTDDADKKTANALENRHVTYFTTLDGGVGFILPLSEKVYRRLLMVQNMLLLQMPHAAGLNPKAYHTVKNTSCDLSNPQRNILDGELLWLFLSLSTSEQNELAKRIGITSVQIIDDLMDIERCTVNF